jgi:orotate phosphoribosyltransferase
VRRVGKKSVGLRLKKHVMESPQTIARTIAGYLLQIQAVRLNASQPFTWASGLKSPIYCDNRQVLSYPDIRASVAREMRQLVRKEYPDVEVIAGVATGAIAIGTLVAAEMDLPFVYVRSTSKGHGLGNQVEGRLMPGSKTVVIEDLVSTGKSSLAAVDALRDAGFDVLGMTAIFSYELPVARQMMQEKHCRLFTLSNYSALLEMALERGDVNAEDMDVLMQWRKDPQAWAENW